ncbi:hypothetical protein DPMN_113766 [Dreissena polymorpha]|uniref:Mab-21-like HhH/H2TH-like domain-containing protein n=1 Tax=Dreissena polymorpha TaxID=45954 RepID=A0A9D4KIX2_DREPO|nr:hypothetical protein DPMN_113766 [Dreissena polymorpha]
MDRDRILNARWRGVLRSIPSGSKAEGLTCYMESDRDTLFVLDDVNCLEDDLNDRTFAEEITVLRSYSKMSYPGHSTLLIERRGTMITSLVNNAMCDDGYGRKVLSSDLYVNTWSHVGKKSEFQVRHDRAGPSLPFTYGGAFHTDTVHAIRYYCPSILKKWAARPRQWPPLSVVQEVESIEAVLTPVGFKGSEHKNVEWRMCFNAGEIKLVTHLNDIQVKLYILMKMVKTEVLKPRQKEVTSYTLKNIVFWIAENNPQALFHNGSLFHWLHKGLDALRVAIVTRDLPYYMIAERNLMAGCELDYELQRSWVSTITDMINEGPKIILRLPKIRQCLIAHPEPLMWYSRRRTELELLELINMNRRIKMQR